MSCNVPVAEAIDQEAVLPERVQEALGELVGPAKEGLILRPPCAHAKVRDTYRSAMDTIASPLVGAPDREGNSAATGA